MTEIVDLREADPERLLWLCNELNSEVPDYFPHVDRFVVWFVSKQADSHIRSFGDHQVHRINRLKLRRQQTIMPPVMPEDPERINEGGDQ